MFASGLRMQLLRQSCCCRPMLCLTPPSSLILLPAVHQDGRVLQLWQRETQGLLLVLGHAMTLLLLMFACPLGCVMLSSPLVSPLLHDARSTAAHCCCDRIRVQVFSILVASAWLPFQPMRPVQLLTQVGLCAGGAAACMFGAPVLARAEMRLPHRCCSCISVPCNWAPAISCRHTIAAILPSNAEPAVRHFPDRHPIRQNGRK